jgi:hypothetical protein
MQLALDARWVPIQDKAMLPVPNKRSVTLLDQPEWQVVKDILLDQPEW